MAPNKNCTTSSLAASQQFCEDDNSECLSSDTRPHFSPALDLTSQSPTKKIISTIIEPSTHFANPSLMPNHINDATEIPPVQATISSPIEISSPAQSGILSASGRSSRRFTVSPVPHGSFLLQLVIPAKKTLKIAPTHQDVSTEEMNNSCTEKQPLLEIASQQSQLHASLSSDSLDEGDFGQARCRHASEASCVTVSTVISTLEIGGQSEKDYHSSPWQKEDIEALQSHALFKADQNSMAPLGLDNPSIILIEPDEEFAALASQFAGQSDADKALLRNNLLRPFEPLEGGSESEEVSQWDVSTKGLRDDAIQFYVGSTYTLRSATSTVSFFNTLYAKGYAPICRICHQTASEKEALESACNCKGSLRYVHHSCLLKWLDMRSRHLGHDPICELCKFQYHPRRVWRNLRSLVFPDIPCYDKVLHTLFFLALISMVICISVSVPTFKTQNNPVLNEDVKDDKAGLSKKEMLALGCGILFFLSFFVAVSAQLKAKWTLYRLFRKFIRMNRVLLLDTMHQKQQH